ncbi:MAG: T9SS type A sorting domain-containing protein [Bacteroidia bacterium]|nr:T9SS type A sorting domain-containing protein [Bacteroidia bacterium]
MKKLLLFLGISAFVNLESQNFTWVQGTSTIDIPATYGTMGSPSALNSPGSRHGCAHWVDASGDLWLFGGEGDPANWHSDLWKYTVSTNQWTWVRGANVINTQGSYGTMGTSSPSNDPGAREFPTSWTDAAGNFWMFGGSGYGSTSTFGILADLWKYNPTTNEWTWMHGYNTVAQPGVYGTLGTAAPTNTPGARYGAGSWKDASGNLWMFGGRGFASLPQQGYLNDLWKYDPATNQWTWMSGANTNNQAGLYGTMSTPSSTNVAGARYFPTIWADMTSELYLLGGFGFSASSAGHLNDLWKYDPVANTWTWLKGQNTANNTAVYGTMGTPAASNLPGGRYTGTSWVDGSGDLWTFGGNGWTASSAAGPGELNDVFRYNIANNEWTWMAGSNQINQNGTYGTMGVPAPGNIPGARMYNTWWKTPDGKFWLYGGEGYDATQTTTGNNNDLWTMTTPCNPDSVTIAPGKIVCSGAPVVLTAHNGGPTTMWYGSPTSTLSLGSGTTLTNSTLTAVSGQSVFTYYAEANSCTATPRPFVTFTVNALPSLTITATTATLCRGEVFTLTASGANTYTWSVASQTAPAIVITPTTVGTPTYIVTGTSTVTGCSTSLSQTVHVNACQGLDHNSLSNNVALFPNPNKGNFNVQISGLDSAELTIYNALGQSVSKHSLINASNAIKTDLTSGIYYYQLKSNSKLITGGKLIIE